MNISKHFIHLIGGVLVLAVMTAGLLLVAMPMWTESRSISADADVVAQTNLGYESQIVALRERQGDLDEIQDAVAELRREIPAEPLLDDVFEVVAVAAASSGVTLVTAAAGETTAWSAREALTADAPPASDEVGAPVDVAPTEEVTPENAAPDANTPLSDAPQVQIDVTLTLTAPSPEAAERFIDALGDGARLIGIVHSSLVSNATDYSLTVNALAFVRTET